MGVLGPDVWVYLSCAATGAVVVLALQLVMDRTRRRPERDPMNRRVEIHEFRGGFTATFGEADDPLLPHDLPPIPPALLAKPPRLAPGAHPSPETRPA